MQLTRELAEGYLSVRRVDPDSVTVGDRRIERSFLITRDRLLEDWDVPSLEALDERAIARVIALAPDVVLLGTGERQAFPPQKLLAEFLTRRIGIEVMDNRAAARTFNVLVSEGRNVVAAFVLRG
jgi:uncharacterized protein